VRWGVASGAALVAIASWVAWRGGRPDPALLADPTKLGEPTKVTVVEGAGVASAPAPAPAAVDRGPLPAQLSGGGFREEKLASFDAENLYVKINGRADYFKAFGFKRLHSALLVSEKDPAVTIDIEMYDLGGAANALGAYGGERGAGIKPEMDGAGLHHFDRNALYVARGPYYVRLIGSDESAVVKERLTALLPVFRDGIKGEPLPWSYALFIGGMGLDPGAVSYFAEGAFSFGFATDVWAARPGGKDSDLELFVSVHGGAPDAKKRAAQLGKGFLEMGEPGGKAGAISLAKDRYLSTFSGAAQVDRWVVGVRGAASAAEAGTQLEKLRGALAALPDDVQASARPTPPKKQGDEYE
jgi:hypothetical protein